MKKITITISILLAVITAKADDLSAVITNSTAGMHNGEIILNITGGTSPYSFAWTGPDGFSSTEKDLASLEAGEYCVTVSDAYCGVAELCVVVEEDPLFSIPVNSAEIISIAPNPFQTDIQLQMNTPKNNTYNFVLTDESGKEIFRFERSLAAGENDIQFPVPANLPAGTYILKTISSVGDITVHKLEHIK